MSRTDLLYERPSRWSRVVVILSALVLGFLAVWVLAPIVLANLAATRAAVPERHEAAAETRSLRAAQDLATPAAEAETESAGELTAVAAPEPPAPAVATVSPIVGPSALGLSADVPLSASTANAIPWPAPFADVEPAAGPAAAAIPEATLPADVGPVPLPRRRPNPALTAHLGVPLPRPRPEAILPEEPAPERSGTDALIDRMGRVE